MHDLTAGDHLDHVELVAARDVEVDLHRAPGADIRAHRRAVDAQVHLDAVAGEREGASRPDRLEALRLEGHRAESEPLVALRVAVVFGAAGLEEALLALQKGALVTEINLVYRQADKRWQFNLKGESLNISSFKIPEIARPETREDLEGYVLEKIYLYDRVVQFLQIVFQIFIGLRVSNSWDQSVVPKIRQWFTTEP